MAEIIFVIIGITAGTGVLIGSILTTYCYCKRRRRNRFTSNAQSIKQQQHPQQQQQREEDYLHSVIINQHIAKHLRPSSAVSFINSQYHNDYSYVQNFSLV